MSEIAPSLEIEYTQANADKAYQEKDYALASDIYRELWSSEKNNTYYFSRLGQSLRKTGDSKEYIELCSEVKANKILMNNEYVVSSICWCLYDCDIKDYIIEDKERYNQFLKSAKYIVSKSQQKEAHEHYMNPYVLTVIKVVKVLKKKNSPPYKKIIEWLSNLEHNKLSDEPFEFTDDNGRDREIASPKEFYYYMMAKAYEKTKQYKECREVCELGLNEIEELHYGNPIWLKARMYYCRCMIEDDNSLAIEEYKKIAIKERHWFMYHKLSDIYFRRGNIEEALLYASKAFDECKFENKKMVSLLQDTAVLWQANGDSQNAKVFYQGSAYYRDDNGWSMNEELEFVISDMEINIDLEPNISLIKQISTNYIESVEGKVSWKVGRIHNTKPKGGYGFITPKNGDENIYFRSEKILGKEILKRGDIVEYQTEEYKGKLRASKVRKKR